MSTKYRMMLHYAFTTIFHPTRLHRAATIASTDIKIIPAPSMIACGKRLLREALSPLPSSAPNTGLQMSWPKD